jgi:hypothetical protein
MRLQAGGIPLQILDDLAVGHQITHTGAGHAVQLGEGAHHDEVLVIGDGVHHGPVVGVLHEVDIGLVHHQQDVLRHLLLEGVELVGVDEGGGGVVGVAEEDGLGLVGDGGQDLVEVRGQGVLLQGDLHQLAPAALDVVIIAGIGGGRQDDLVAGLDEHLGDEAQARGSALGDHDLIHGQAVLLRQLLAQVLGPDIGIAVGQRSLLANGLGGLGGGAEGVFVGGQLQQLGHAGPHALGLLVRTHHIGRGFLHKFTDQILNRHFLFLHKVIGCPVGTRYP